VNAGIGIGPVPIQERRDNFLAKLGRKLFTVVGAEAEDERAALRDVGGSGEALNQTSGRRAEGSEGVDEKAAQGGIGVMAEQGVDEIRSSELPESGGGTRLFYGLGGHGGDVSVEKLDGLGTIRGGVKKREDGGELGGVRVLNETCQRTNVPGCVFGEDGGSYPVFSG
jgi:hypothetical protein